MTHKNHESLTEFSARIDKAIRNNSPEWIHYGNDDDTQEPKALSKTRPDPVNTRQGELKSKILTTCNTTKKPESVVLAEELKSILDNNDKHSLVALSLAAFPARIYNSFFVFDHNLKQYKLSEKPNRDCSDIHVFHYAVQQGSVACVDELLSSYKYHDENLKNMLAYYSMTDDRPSTAWDYITAVSYTQPMRNGEFMSEKTRNELVHLFLEYGQNPYGLSKKSVSLGDKPTALVLAERAGNNQLVDTLKAAYQKWDKEHFVRTKTLQFLSVLGQLITGKRIQKHKAKPNNNNQSRQNGD